MINVQNLLKHIALGQFWKTLLLKQWGKYMKIWEGTHIEKLTGKSVKRREIIETHIGNLWGNEMEHQNLIDFSKSQVYNYGKSHCFNGKIS